MGFYHAVPTLIIIWWLQLHFETSSPTSNIPVCVEWFLFLAIRDKTQWWREGSRTLYSAKKQNYYVCAIKLCRVWEMTHRCQKNFCFRILVMKWFLQAVVGVWKMMLFVLWFWWWWCSFRQWLKWNFKGNGILPNMWPPLHPGMCNTKLSHPKHD